MIKYFAMSLLFLFSNLVMAEQIGMPQGNDARVQIFNYDPSDVYLINTKVGYSTLVQLEKGEEITDAGGLGMGDALSWSLAVRGNNIFFKPISVMADTNLVLVTNKRSYAFQLSTMGNETTYIARFNYPDVPQESHQNEKNEKQNILPDYLYLVAKDSQGNDLLIDVDINMQYIYRGNQELKPTNAWDDGRFTYLKFNHAGDLPTVYRVLADGSETLVNTHTEADTLILHEIGALYRLRFGSAVGEVANQNQKLPKFNVSGASDKQFVRLTN